MKRLDGMDDSKKESQGFEDRDLPDPDRAWRVQPGWGGVWHVVDLEEYARVFATRAEAEEFSARMKAELQTMAPMRDVDRRGGENSPGGAQWPI